jgi:hypothetical protein
VKANIANGSQNGLVIDSFSYAGSHETSDGSVVDLGPKTFDQYYYTAPDGTVYMGNGGPDTASDTAVLGPIVNGKRSVTESTINNANHTYSQTQTTEVYGSAAANARARPAVNLNSTSSEVLRALQSGQVTQLGMTTVNGTPAIALSIKKLRIPGTLIVDVDAQTYRPLRAVATVTGNSSPPPTSPTGSRPRPTTSPRPRASRSPPATRRSTTTPVTPVTPAQAIPVTRGNTAPVVRSCSD